jgi:phosphate transport system substrate-binding protein
MSSERTRTFVVVAASFVAALLISLLIHNSFTRPPNTRGGKSDNYGGQETMRTSTKTALVATALLGAGAAVAAETRLQGGGATFPDPLYQKWVSEYQTAHPDVKIDYQAIGSGGGIKGITEKTFAFAGSDAPMNKGEIEKAGGPDALVQVPSCAGGVVPAYNVPGVKGELKFTGPVLAEIFMGTITKWNDPKLVALNADAGLPDLAITPAYRTDGSGTNFVWTNYLATQSEEFKSTIGTGKSVKWPIGQGGNGNKGVAAIVQSTGGALGYIEANFADNNKIPYGSVKNRSGKFVKASAATISAAGAGAVDQMKGAILAANIWDQPGDEAYPAASFTYLIVYKKLDSVKSKDAAKALMEFIWWAEHDGQKLAPDLGYAPLAKAVQDKVDQALSVVTFNGESLNVGR